MKVDLKCILYVHKKEEYNTDLISDASTCRYRTGTDMAVHKMAPNQKVLGGQKCPFYTSTSSAGQLNVPAQTKSGTMLLKLIKILSFSC